MKRTIQSFAIMLISLLAAGPALAALSCGLSNTVMGSSCPMGMAKMDADCPMSQNLAAADCSQDCCNRALPQAVVTPGIPAKPRLSTPAPAIFSFPPALPSGIRSTSEPASRAVATSPPRYLLLRVFRI